MDKNNIKIHILDANKTLTKFYNLIADESKNAIENILKKMPVENVDIVIYDNPYDVIKEIGIGGKTHTPNTVLIPLDPNFDNFTKAIEVELPRTIAHEMHHAKRWQTVGYGDTLLDSMISEGLADHFDLEINSGKTDPWTHALSLEQMTEYFEKAKKEFNSKEYNHSDWFFGTSKDIPRWTGYTLGFRIVGDYLKRNPDKKPSTLFDQKSEEFIV